MRTLIISVLLAATLPTAAQTFGPNFLGEDFALYKGTLFRLVDNPISGLTYAFYAHPKDGKSLVDAKVLYPDVKYSFKSVADSLSGRIFRVTDIVNEEGLPYTHSFLAKQPYLVLTDTLTKQVIYFKYDSKYEHNFIFLTTPVELDAAVLCTKITRRVDDFDGQISIESPLIENKKLSPMTIHKVIDGSKTEYYLHLRASGLTVTVGETHVIVLFVDGTKWTRENKIDVEVDDGFQYKAFIKLNATDLALFSNKQVNKFRLYIHDNTMDPLGAKKFTHFVQCVMDRK